MALRLKKTASLTACFLLLVWSAALADEGSLTLPVQANGDVELVLQSSLLKLEPSNVLQVFIGKPERCCEGKSPVAGRYLVDGFTVVFDPAFDFVEGQIYTVLTQQMIDSSRKVRNLTAFTLKKDGVFKLPEVVSIYPSGSMIPENTLRFYIHFSTPMKPHMSAKFIKLVDASGTPDTAAFMALKQELWNEDRTRLTLLMDPGRIKRGVAQNVSLGPALIAGNRYTIVVEEGWSGASGKHVAPSFEKSFSASSALRTLPHTKLWDIRAPKLSTRESLSIEFDRPFDSQSVHSAITVLDENQRPILGKATMEHHEKVWRFQPQEVWASKRVRIVVDARLEDVAGNNFRELLDHSVETGVETFNQRTIDLELSPRSP